MGGSARLLRLDAGYGGGAVRFVIAWLLGWQVVWLQDHDGAIHQRLARPTPYGLLAYRMSRVFRIAPILLLPDGVTKGRCYVVSWKPTEAPK
jgi:hypothetical protein